MTDFNLETACRQRAKRMLFSYPTNRFDIISPYTDSSYTPFDLDMRRKAEILEYKGNTQASKSNNPTKKQNLSNVLSGKYQTKTYGYNTYYESVGTYREAMDITEYTYNLVVERDMSNNIDTDCSTGIIYTPSTASGVPGPVINLYKDESVPLYNYSKNTNALALTEDVDPDKWRIIINENIEVGDDMSGALFLLGIMGGIDDPIYTFNFEIPVGMYIRGTAKTLINQYTDLSLSLNKVGNILPIDIQVNYNEEVVNRIGTNTKLDPDIQFVFKSGDFDTIGFSFDLSGNDLFDVSTNTFGSYEIRYYLGQIKVSNMPLYTENGYIYDIITTNNLLFTIDTQGEYNEQFENTEYGLIYNMIIDASNSVTNATLKTPPTTTINYYPFEINGEVTSSSEIEYTTNVGTSSNNGTNGNTNNSGNSGSSGSSGYTY